MHWSEVIVLFSMIYFLRRFLTHHHLKSLIKVGFLVILFLMFSLSVWSISIMLDRRKKLSQESIDEDFEVLKKELSEKNFSGVEKICTQGNSFIKKAMTLVFKAGNNPEAIDRALISFIKEEKMKLEHHKQRVAPLPYFLFRLGRYGLFALGLIVFSVLLGTIGYHLLGQISWLDSFYMACMILTGMGPVAEMVTPSAKIFSSLTIV